MFTIGEFAMRAMVNGYRRLRSNGTLPNGSHGTLTYEQDNELRDAITTELAYLVNAQPLFAMHLVPLIESLAFAIAMTEQYPLGSDRYCAWRDYELHLHGLAIAANQATR